MQNLRGQKMIIVRREDEEEVYSIEESTSVIIE